MSSPSPKTIARWNSALKYLQYCPAIGGVFNDAPSLVGTIRFEGLSGLLALFALLEHPLIAIPPGAPRVVAGQSYTHDEMKALPDPIWDWPDYAQPGLTTLFGIPVYLTVHAQELSLHLFGAEGDPWSITQADFKHAQKLEAELIRRGIEPDRETDDEVTL